MWNIVVLYALTALLSLGELSFYHPEWVEINVTKTRDNVHITTSSHSTGKAQVWVPIGSIEYVSDSDVLLFKIHNSGSPMQLSVFFRKEGGRDYYMKRIFIPETEKLAEYRVELNSYKKVFAPNVIEKLKADTDAGLILHFQNTEPGALKFNLSEISITGGR